MDDDPACISKLKLIETNIDGKIMNDANLSVKMKANIIKGYKEGIIYPEEA